MRIGFSSIYAWRPHVEHLHYLADLAREAGHQVSFLTCDADLTSCYTQELLPKRNRVVHCTRCRLGGLRSFEGQDVHSIGRLADDRLEFPEWAREWCLSSVSTLGRFESDADFASPEFHALATRLEGPTRRAYSATRRWIEQERLDAVCVFNGRMDATRAIIEAARAVRLPFVSVERTWFGDGLQLLPSENCLGLHNVHAMTTAWRHQPLTRGQAVRAASHIASRFLSRNIKEWRAYNLTAIGLDWPTHWPRHRILLLPGSRNEVWGHPDWRSEWPDHLTAFDALIDHLGLQAQDLVLRCHPNWGERIGAFDGTKAESHYTNWARKRGIHCIASNNAASTQSLIQQCDAIVVCGGSAALEAGALGKQVIAVSPSPYQHAGFQSNAQTPTALELLKLHADLDDDERAASAANIARKTLRFAYTMLYRLPQYVDHVRCITTTRYEYLAGANPDRFIRLLNSGVLEPDDALRANGSRAEDEALSLIASRQWHTLMGQAPVPVAAPRRKVQRRLHFRPIDWIRDALPRGDL